MLDYVRTLEAWSEWNGGVPWTPAMLAARATRVPGSGSAAGAARATEAAKRARSFENCILVVIEVDVVAIDCYLSSCFVCEELFRVGSLWSLYISEYTYEGKWSCLTGLDYACVERSM